MGTLTLSIHSSPTSQNSVNRKFNFAEFYLSVVRIWPFAGL
jgi:hypothetical protein